MPRRPVLYDINVAGWFYILKRALLQRIFFITAQKPYKMELMLLYTVMYLLKQAVDFQE